MVTDDELTPQVRAVLHAIVALDVACVTSSDRDELLGWQRREMRLRFIGDALRDLLAGRCGLAGKAERIRVEGAAI
jgi:hypothetical protein